MATYDHTRGGNTAHSYASGFGRMPFLLEQSIDFVKANRANGDVLQVLSIPANTLVLWTAVDVEIVEGGTATATLGDGDDPDGFIPSANLNSGGTTAQALALTTGTPNTVTGYSNGKFYAEADTIDLVLANDCDAAKVRIRALCFDVSANGDPSS